MAELKQLASNDSDGVQFVKDAVRQLVEARHTLIASYGYGYFIMVVRVKDEFEKIQVNNGCGWVCPFYGRVFCYREILRNMWKALLK